MITGYSGRSSGAGLLILGFRVHGTPFLHPDGNLVVTTEPEIGLANELDLDAYFSRVGLPTAPPLDEEGLRVLQQAQFFNIPFENFDIQLGRGIDLAPEALVAKLVHRQRGGYCFELNGLMLMVLCELGFQARPLLARVHLGGEISGRTHQMSLVELAGRSWLVDVGFGAGGLRCPLPMEMGHSEEGPGWAFRLVEHETWGIMMQTRTGQEWRDSYSFDLLVVAAADIALGNHYTSTAPMNKFVTTRIASLPRATGRVSLRNDVLIEVGPQGKSQRKIPAGGGYLDILKSVFGIDLDAQYTDLRVLTPE